MGGNGGQAAGLGRVFKRVHREERHRLFTPIPDKGDDLVRLAAVLNHARGADDRVAQAAGVGSGVNVMYFKPLPRVGMLIIKFLRGEHGVRVRGRAGRTDGDVDDIRIAVLKVLLEKLQKLVGRDLRGDRDAAEFVHHPVKLRVVEVHAAGIGFVAERYLKRHDLNAVEALVLIA